MKPSTLIAAATALIGFATGWLLKPSGEAAAGGASPPREAGAKRPALADGKSRERDERPLVLKARGGGEMTADPELATAQVAFERGFQNATERAEHARLSRLAEALGLSPGQRATMEVLLANRRDGFRQLNGNGLSPSEMVAQAARAERSFEQQVAKLLDPEQAEAFAAFKGRAKENEIEARAQRDLADLIVQIDLSPAQREQATEALRVGSADAVAKLPDGWDLINESYSMLGGAHAAVLEDMSEFMGDDAAMGDSQEFHRRLVQSKRAAMDRKVARLAPILTPGQLAQYRSTLEARTTFIEQVTPPKYQKR
jgi:hypothetical protein